MKEVIRYSENREKNTVSRMSVIRLKKEEIVTLEKMNYSELLARENDKQDIIVLEVADFSEEKYENVRKCFEKIETKDERTVFVASGYIICIVEKFNTAEDALLKKCIGKYADFTEYAGRTQEVGSNFFIPKNLKPQEKVFVCVNKRPTKK